MLKRRCIFKITIIFIAFIMSVCSNIVFSYECTANFNKDGTSSLCWAFDETSGWREEEGSDAHSGKDLYAQDWNRGSTDDDLNEPVYAVIDGTVIYVGCNDYGNSVMISSNDKDFIVTYAHLNKIAVSKGDVVTISSLIGHIGKTGGMSHSHLHLSLYKNMKDINVDNNGYYSKEKVSSENAAEFELKITKDSDLSSRTNEEGDTKNYCQTDGNLISLNFSIDPNSIDEELSYDEKMLTSEEAEKDETALYFDIPANKEYTKTWVVKNTGDAWLKDYSYRFCKCGDSLDGCEDTCSIMDTTKDTKEVTLKCDNDVCSDIKNGSTVTLEVSGLIAPATVGKTQTWWLFQVQTEKDSPYQKIATLSIDLDVQTDSDSVNDDNSLDSSNGGTVNDDTSNNGDVKKCEFPDIPKNVEYKKAVLELCRLGIVKGYDDETFKPDQKVTRVEFLKMVLRAKAKAKGYEDGEYECITEVDGEQKDCSSKVAQNYINAGMDFPQHKICDELFTDETAIRDARWAWPYINYAVKTRIMVGYPKGHFGPDKDIRRDEAIKILVNTIIVDEELKDCEQEPKAQSRQNANVNAEEGPCKTNAFIEEEKKVFFTDVNENNWVCEFLKKFSDFPFSSSSDNYPLTGDVYELLDGYDGITFSSDSALESSTLVKRREMAMSTCKVYAYVKAKADSVKPNFENCK